MNGYDICSSRPKGEIWRIVEGRVTDFNSDGSDGTRTTVVRLLAGTWNWLPEISVIRHSLRATYWQHFSTF
jgi:hypothetical protein